MRKAKIRREQESLLSTARQELVEVRSELEQAYSVFNNTSDPDVIETSILEISALQSKYSRMLKKLKNIQGA